MSKTNNKFIMTIGAFLLATLPAASQAVDLKQGKWGFTDTDENVLLGRSKESYREQCITVAGYDPIAEFADRMKMQGAACTFNRTEDTPDSTEILINCPLPNTNQSLTGLQTFTVTGETATGVRDLKMKVDDYHIRTTTQAEYLGACG